MHCSLVDVNQSRDPDGLRCFYYLVQVIYSWTLIPQLVFLTYYAGSEVPGVLPHWPPFQDQANLNLKRSPKRKGRPKEAAGIVPHRILQKKIHVWFFMLVKGNWGFISHPIKQFQTMSVSCHLVYIAG